MAPGSKAAGYLMMRAVSTSGSQPCPFQFQGGDTGRDEVTINDCPMDIDIDVVFSPGSGIPKLLTDVVRFFTLNCQNSPPEGFTRPVVDNSWVTNVISTQKQDPITPAIALKANIGQATESATVEPGGTTTAPSVGLFEKLPWTVSGPEGYRVMPLSCTATSGPIEGQEVQSITLVENGCSLQLNLLSNFRMEDPEKPHILVADLFAFRFPGSNELNLACQVKGCRLTSRSCDFVRAIV
ncbi:hypothetical protein MAR_020933 [Mya arenaria]|uniref:ZP domain-containing protein n=1 Tax=Mya arenaria TaxID=6604 RepID=A0ABY7E8P6_MYAAR|nr:hypothetical protein MAR_020933 [Mya arenaria]